MHNTYQDSTVGLTAYTVSDLAFHVTDHLIVSIISGIMAPVVFHVLVPYLRKRLKIDRKNDTDPKQ